MPIKRSQGTPKTFFSILAPHFFQPNILSSVFSLLSRGVPMRRFLLIALLCLGSLSVYARNPPEEWKAYRIARVTANGKSSQEKVKIWSDYLAKYPESPYRDRALEELEEASGSVWQLQPATPASNCGPDFDMNAALGVAPRDSDNFSSTPTSATPELDALFGENSKPALQHPDRLQVPEAANKRPIGAGLRSLGWTYGGVVLGSMILQGSVNSRVQVESNNSEALGLALIGSAMVLGPSAGHLYAGDKAHAKKMITARAIATGVGLLGLYGGLESQPTCIDFCAQDTSSGDAAVALGVIGLTTAYVLALYDIGDSFFVVQRMQGRPVKARLRTGSWTSYSPRY
jgi:hypothetical protein